MFLLSWIKTKLRGVQVIYCRLTVAAACYLTAIKYSDLSLTCPLLSTFPVFLFFFGPWPDALLSRFLFTGVSGLIISVSFPLVAACTLAMKDFCLATKSGLSLLRVDLVLVGVLEVDRELRWLDLSDMEGVSEPASDGASRSLPVCDPISLRLSSSSDTVSGLSCGESSSGECLASDIFLHSERELPPDLKDTRHISKFFK